MTPQERQLVDDLFDRLARLETSPREADAEAAIADGLRRAPNAVYAMVQTVLLQDEALRRADARIRELEGGEPEPRPAGGFLDAMRDTLFGTGAARGSVPSVRPGETMARSGPTWNSGQVLGQQAPGQVEPRPGGFGAGPSAAGNGGGGGSFLGTAAAAAAGMIGGAMLMNGIRGLMGGGHPQGLGDTASSGGKNPWDSGASSGDLARDAGLNDMGRSDDRGGERQGFAEHASNDYDDSDDDYDDDDYDSGDFDLGDSDFA
jgi:hypothetical protein